MSPASAAEKNLALYIDKDIGTYLLYDPVELEKQLRGENITAAAVYGVVIVNMHSDPDHLQWGAKEIEFTAARSGYGPMMYDIAMADVGGLVPDRGSVSPAARGIWDFYKNDRPDVEKKQIDNVDNPLTDTTEDDGVRYEEEPGDPLDQAYFLDSGPDVSVLIANHKTALPMLKQVSAESGRHFNFAAIAQMFFDQQYDG
jgi:hypothetical protein